MRRLSIILAILQRVVILLGGDYLLNRSVQRVKLYRLRLSEHEHLLLVLALDSFLTTKSILGRLMPPRRLLDLNMKVLRIRRGGFLTRSLKMRAICLVNVVLHSLHQHRVALQLGDQRLIRVDTLRLYSVFYLLLKSLDETPVDLFVH